MSDTMNSHIKHLQERLKAAEKEIEHMRAVCAASADQLAASYMHLPRDQFPGPPETIIDRLREAAGPTFNFEAPHYQCISTRWR